ncbi:enoyl-CoA hydratase/isomerase family protein [Halovenus rubra]|uniref:Enoyl-CoA hydratase/isomerase family protein n=2 Tax=Halovenus rubra TaxID=869890 RepID=A0ACC7E1P5_9EURY|nr:enoyl-CoA hydratase/isomerase family protein [Halovenus rubra]
MSNLLTIEQAEGIATIRFDNPEQRNALDIDGANELVEAATTLGNDPDVRCIVLSHSGQFYGTGADLTALDGDASDEQDIRRLAGRLHEAIIQFHQSPTPVVGGIDGIAAGASFGLALLPDLLVVSEDARLEFAYPRIGLTGDAGSTFFLPRLVGLRAAKEIVLLDEPISAERAVDLGLATEAVPSERFEERLDELATQIAEGPTTALGEASRLVTESFDHSIESQLAAETDTIGQATRSKDYERGFASFFSDQEPEFTGE